MSKNYRKYPSETPTWWTVFCMVFFAILFVVILWVIKG